MKVISYIGLALALIGACASLYAFTTVVPHELAMRDSDNRFGWRIANDAKVLVGYAIIGLGMVGTILSIVVFFKTKTKIALVALIVNLAVIGYWLTAFTHMFS